MSNQLRRSLFVSGVCFSLLAFSPTNARADFASFAGFDPNCAAVGQAGPAPALDAAFFNGLRVRASGDGTTGVFFLERDGNTFVLKFEDELALGVTAARRFLAEKLVPHDTTLAEFTDPAIIKALFDETKISALASLQTLTAAQQIKLQQRLSRLDGLFAPGGTPPRKVSLTQFLNAKVGMASLGAGLELPPSLDRLSPAEAATAILHFHTAVSALNSPHNQGFLGYLYIADAFLGNEDRLVKPTFNFANVFLAEGTQGADCMAAIDNDAFAPTAHYVASVQGMPKTVPKPKIRTDNSKNPPVDIETPETFKSGKLSLSSGDYLDALLNFFKDRSVGRVYTGPDAAITLQYFDKKANRPPIVPPSICEQQASRDPFVQSMSWIGQYVRQQLVTNINKNVRAIGQLDQELVYGGATTENSGRDGDVLPLPALMSLDGFADVCSTKIDMAYQDPNSDNGTVVSLTVDWNAFDENFAQGAALALKDFARIDIVSNQVGIDNMRDTIDAMLQGMPIGKYSTLSKTGFVARALYFKHYLGGIKPSSIKQLLLANYKKEAFTTSISVSGLKYLGYSNGRWVLQAPE